MTHPIKKILSLSLLFIVFVSACAPAAPSAAPTAPASAAAVEFLNLSQASATAGAPGEAPKPLDTATAEPTATHTPEPTPTPLPVVISTTAASGCTNLAEFVKHLTVSDFTELKPVKPFAKMWQVKNVGTCTWTTAYKLVFVSGNPMSGPNEIPLPHDVLPGETVDLRVNLVSPDSSNRYENSWMFQDENGNFFGVGRNHDQPLMVRINIPTKITPHPS